MPSKVTLTPIEGMPEIAPGDDVGALIVDAVARQRTPLQDADVLIVTQKVVSKAEGRIVDLRTVTPSARRIRDRVREVGAEVAVIVSDTFGRPWREGAANIAIGVAGMEPLWDYRGLEDTDGRELHSTVVAVADELAAAAELVMKKLDRVPAAIARGYAYTPGESGIAPIIRERAKDLFR